MSKDVEKTEYGTGTWDTPPSDEDYTLEEILAEYGSSRQQKIMEEVEHFLIGYIQIEGIIIQRFVEGL